LVAGQLGAEFFLSRASLPFLVAGLVIYYFGWAMFRAVLFPWSILFLMVPIPAIIFNEITFPLQFLASKLASAMLPFIGVPVLRLGNVIQLPMMTLEVADACSGIRSLMSLEALAVIYGYVMEKRTWARLTLIVAAVPIAVLANALRIVGTGACVQYWDPDKAEGFFHSFSGWLIFIVAVAMLLAVHSLLRLIGRKKRPLAV
jgi:exosortase